VNLVIVKSRSFIYTCYGLVPYEYEHELVMMRVHTPTADRFQWNRWSRMEIIDRLSAHFPYPTDLFHMDLTRWLLVIVGHGDGTDMYKCAHVYNPGMYGFVRRWDFPEFEFLEAISPDQTVSENVSIRSNKSSTYIRT
jgi:hypothetical protein